MDAFPVAGERSQPVQKRQDRQAEAFSNGFPGKTGGFHLSQGRPANSDFSENIV